MRLSKVDAKWKTNPHKTKHDPPSCHWGALSYPSQRWKQTGLELSTLRPPNKASDECGNPASPVGPSSPRYASIFWTVTASSARWWSQHCLGSRWLPQSPPLVTSSLGICWWSTWQISREWWQQLLLYTLKYPLDIRMGEGPIKWFRTFALLPNASFVFWSR